MNSSSPAMELDPKYDDYDYPTTAPVAAPGHPGHLKPEEQAQVHQLRLLLEAEGYTKRLDTLTLVCDEPENLDWGGGFVWAWVGYRGQELDRMLFQPPVILDWPSRVIFKGPGTSCFARDADALVFSCGSFARESLMSWRLRRCMHISTPGQRYFCSALLL